MKKPNSRPKSNRKPKIGFTPAVMQIVPVYRQGEVNHCPGCARAQWLIGRVTAECAFCSTTLPLAEAPSYGSSIVRVVTKRDRERLLAAAA